MQRKASERSFFQTQSHTPYEATSSSKPESNIRTIRLDPEVGEEKLDGQLARCQIN
jgi:hypothetical protein